MAATWTSCDCSEFVSDATEFLAGLVKELSRERTASYSCAVCLEDTVDMSDEVWVNSKSYACT